MGCVPLGGQAFRHDRAYVRYEWAAALYYWLWHGVPVFVNATS